MIFSKDGSGGGRPQHTDGACSAICRSTLIENGVIAIVGKSISFILLAPPIIVKSVSITVSTLDGFDASFGDDALLLHIVFRIRHRRHRLHNANHGAIRSTIKRMQGLGSLGEFGAGLSDSKWIGNQEGRADREDQLDRCMFWWIFR